MLLGWGAESGDLMSDVAISEIRIFGLHQQFNVDLKFSEGLNVLYGKNGRGKTTVLHVIANALELDFFRFRFLQFDRIELDTFKGDQLIIINNQDADTRIKLMLNGLEINLDQNFQPNHEDAKLLRNTLGSRPVYLPAFRSILERARSESYVEAQRSSEFEQIRESERSLQRESESRERRTAYVGGRYDLPGLNARKTVQCREWFGQFVPIIRYPSIIEVTDRLATEYRDAQLEVGMLERRMLSSMFVEVFKALLSEEDIPSESEVETLLERVRLALESDEDVEANHFNESDHLGSRLAEVVDSMTTQGGSQAGAAERRVLRLYATMLEKRNKERESSFERVHQFEDAVNKFLDNKTLHISDDRKFAQRSGRGVYVESTSGRRYPLSSLSSGERQVLTMIFSATRMSVTPGVFLIDEPELSLHVDWQRIILSELMSQAGGRQIIACTHSPEVGADHSESVEVFNPSPYLPIVCQVSDEGADSLLDDAL